MVAGSDMHYLIFPVHRGSYISLPIIPISGSTVVVEVVGPDLHFLCPVYLVNNIILYEYIFRSAVVVVRPDLLYLIFPAHGRSWMLDLGRPWTKVADTSRPEGVRERSPIWKQLFSIYDI